MTNLPVLWQYSFSHYNEKARWALDHKRIAHERRSLLPGSPRAMRFSANGGTLPVLDFDGERVVDSTRIIEFLERRQREPALYPDDPDELRRALELEEFLDERVGHELRRVAFFDWDPSFAAELMSADRSAAVRAGFRALLPIGWLYARRRYGITPEEVERSRGRIVAGLDRLEAELAGDEYLVGQGFSVADLTAASLLFPLAWPDEVVLPRPERWEFREQLAEHPALEWVRQTYRRHRGTSAEA